MQTSTKIMIAATLVVLPIIIISASGDKSRPQPAPAAAAPGTQAPQSPYPPQAGVKRLGVWDTNNDGALDKDEWLAGSRKDAEKKFNGLDLNHDGLMTRQEIDTVRAQRRAAWDARNKARMAKQQQAPAKNAPAGKEKAAPKKAQ